MKRFITVIVLALALCSAYGADKLAAFESANPLEQTARQIVFKGRIVDDKNVPVAGAVVVSSSDISRASITGSDGDFSVSATDGEEFTVSCLGYETLKLSASSEERTYVLNIDSELLEEVVVVGYGVQRVATVTGSVSQVKSEKLTVAPVQNATQTLAGQLPGLVSKQTSGLPGQDNASLNIRGFGSPLVIVDGIEGSLETIDAGQIESVSILKDGSGSIYGARAGNGVILVTTKSGGNNKTTVSFNTSFTLQGNIVTTLPASSSQRAQFQNDKYLNKGGKESRKPYSDEDIVKFQNATDRNHLNTDWYHAVVRPFSPQHNHNLSISGGTDRLKYYAYAGYNRQETQFKPNGGYYDRFNFQTNLTAKITSNLTAGINMQIMKDDKNYPSGGDLYQDGVNFWDGIIYAADPRYPLTLPYNDGFAYANMQNGSPVWAVNIENSGYHRNKRLAQKYAAYLEYAFSYLPGLKAKAHVLYTEGTDNLKWMHKRGSFYTYDYDADILSFAGNSVAPSSLTYSTSVSDNVVQQYSLSYDRDFSGHNVNALLMYESTLSHDNYYSTQRSGFESTVIEEMMAGDPETAENTSNSYSYGRRSVIFRADYNYMDKYMVEATVRADASSRFAKGYRWGVFPSVSAGWNIAKEDFVSCLGVVDNLKLRISAGASGYDAVALFNYLTGYSYDVTYSFGDKLVNGLASTGLPNKELSWEKMAIYNLGLDFGLFGRKLYGSVDVFQRDRTGIPGYRVQSIPDTFGATLPQENLNAIRSRGFEFLVGNEGRAGDFRYDINANISYNRSRWLFYDQAKETDPDRARLYTNTGNYIDRQIGYVSDGIFTSKEDVENWKCTMDALDNDNSSLAAGDIKYKDLNDDGVINWRDQKEIGKGSMPHWMSALNFNLAWRGIDLSLLFQGAWGYTTVLAYNDNTATYCNLYYDERHNANPNALVCRPQGAVTNWLASDFYYRDTAYLRLKNAALGYTVPERFLKKVKITKLRIYLAGMNLFTLSNISKYGVDPESSGAAVGYSYPQQYTMSIGLNLSF